MDPIRVTRIHARTNGASYESRPPEKRGRSKKRKTKDKDILVKIKAPDQPTKAPEEPTKISEESTKEELKVDASTDTKDAETYTGTNDVGTSTKADVGINTETSVFKCSIKEIGNAYIGDLCAEQLDETSDEPAKQRAMLADVRAGLQKAYLDGIEFMRLKIKETEEELDQIKMGFYQCDTTEDDQFEKYLITVNEQFLQANNELRRKNVKLKVIDGEVQIVSMLNELREHCEVDRGEIAFISELWENMKTSVERLKVLVDKFKSSVMDRLRGNCISYNNADIRLEVAIRYTEEVSQYLADIERGLQNTQILVKSFANGVHQDLFEHTKFTEKILVACDLKAFPILRLFPDLTEKIELMCTIALKWLDRDERYMYEINDYIKETRSMTKRRADDLKVQKNKMKKFEKSVKAANILLHNNKEKLQKLEGDLNQLESTMDVYKQQLELKNGEKNQKESMVDFLKITVSQTKKNYNLQLKRQRLLKQVTQLEEFLQTLERDLHSVQNKIQEKAQQKDMLAEKVGDSEKTAGMLKTDLERFTDNLNQLEHEVNSLSGQLLQLEIIQTYKSSPESMDEVYDRPQSVKLAPSLKEKIKQRKRKIMAPVH